MKNYAIFGSLVMLAFLLTWFSPVSSSAFTIKYNEGYNDARVKIAQTYEMPIRNTKTAPNKANLGLTNSLSTTTSSTTPVYVTNPMSSNLDVGNYHIGSYNTTMRTIYVDSNLFLGTSTSNGWELYTPSIRAENNNYSAPTILSIAYGAEAKAGQFTADGVRGKAGSFLATGAKGYAIYAEIRNDEDAASSTPIDNYAGYFKGDVNIDGDLKMRPHGELIFGIPDPNPLGPTEDRYKITSRFSNHDNDWAGFIMSSNDDLGMVIDANDDNELSAFRIGASDPPDAMSSGREIFTVQANGKVGIGNTSPSKSLDIVTHDGSNAEISIETGGYNSNTHWGIYQEGSSGKLNFWHGGNRVEFSDKGVSATNFCLAGKCISNWSELKNILYPPTPNKPTPYQPVQQ